MSATDLVAVLVHHRTPERIRPAAQALRQQASAAGCTLRVVVVDQSGEAPSGEDWEILRPLDNLGYAGGFNAAVREVPQAAYYLLLNPDVALEDGALGRLLDHGQPTGAVGPMLFWDRDYRLLQPPTWDAEAPTWLHALHRISPDLGVRARRRRWREHARTHWQTNEPLATRHLSGACLLIGRAALDRIGPMDERFRLYFEETDWLRRLAASGGRSLLVPTAHGVHDFDASASQESRRDEWFADSEALYRARYSVRPDLPSCEQDLPTWTGRAEVKSGEVWFELSPFCAGVPAAAERVQSRSDEVVWAPPVEVAGRVAGFALTLVDSRGRELGRYRMGASE